MANSGCPHGLLMTSRPDWQPPASPTPRKLGHQPGTQRRARPFAWGGEAPPPLSAKPPPPPARPKKAGERDGDAITLALPVILLVLARVDLGALSELLRAAAHLSYVLHGGGKGGRAAQESGGDSRDLYCGQNGGGRDPGTACAAVIYPRREPISAALSPGCAAPLTASGGTAGPARCRVAGPP